MGGQKGRGELNREKLVIPFLFLFFIHVSSECEYNPPNTNKRPQGKRNARGKESGE
jgi:hypothetical protein